MAIVSIFVAALACYAAGAVYYMLLSKHWMAAAGFTEEDIDPKNREPFIIAAISSVFAAWMLRLILKAADAATPLMGIFIGAGIGAFIVGAWIFLNNGYESKPIKLSAINTGYAIIGLGIMGGVLGLFGGV